jgi:hypothetical protein
LLKFLCERPSGETPGALESIFVFQNPPFDQYPSLPAEPPNELRITQGVRVSVRLIVFFCDETQRRILLLVNGGDDDKIEEMDMVSIKRRWGNGSPTRT